MRFFPTKRGSSDLDGTGNQKEKHMILDKFLQFDPNPTLITVTAPSTNVIDLINAREMSVDIGPAQLAAVVTVIVALVAAGAATLTVQYQQSTDNAAWTIAAQTDAIPKANLTAGQQ